MKFNVYDMLVFEDESSSIYQDCVCSITNNSIKCNCAEIKINADDAMDIIWWMTCYDGYNEGFKLKEIWTRTDEDTYKKVWEK